MSVEREGKIIRFSCDGGACHRNYESEEIFATAWHEAKSDGWVNSVHRDTWQHFCPHCKKELGD